MAQSASISRSMSAREASIARRTAMATTGKAALAAKGTGRSPSTGSATASARPAAARAAGAGLASARAASRARRLAMAAGGKASLATADRSRTPQPAASSAGQQAPRKSDCSCGCKDGSGQDGRQAPTAAVMGGDGHAIDSGSRSTRPARASVRKAARAAGSASRNVSMARRQAMASRGKAGVSRNGVTAAQTARAGNPDLSSRDLSKALRVQRTQRGGAGQKRSEPCGRQRPGKRPPGAAEDQTWKVGASQTAHGQTVTGTQVGRSQSVTGDEASTCRNVTGTEYLGADIFREFCQSEPSARPRKVGLSPTSRGNRVTGNELGRGRSVTGDEPGTCKRVTGTEYIAAGQSEAFCGTQAVAGPAKVTRSQTTKGKTVTGNNVGRSEKVTGDETGAARELTGTPYMQAGSGKAPAKVGISSTLRGRRVSGTQVGRSAAVTGDEPGACRNVTGDDYVGQEHYNGFCSATPKPQDEKVGVSRTFRGMSVSGTMTGRAAKVTGDEPGTCQAITGTPYAGAEQYRSHCEPEAADVAAARTRLLRGTPGSAITGQQPGVGGKMTGAGKGVCEPVSGTPYVGADQHAAVCPATPAASNSPDFPQPLGAVPWGQFSVAPPAHAAQTETQQHAVTGTRYEKGHITGPFGMASGKVTGTEEARFDRGRDAVPAELPETAQSVSGRVQSRITGEGMDAGPKITGDDWERGDRVTGTEGAAALVRNPTRRGGPGKGAMPMRYPRKRNAEMTEPVSPVTGGSGNTDKGALVTYSGGARG